MFSEAILSAIHLCTGGGLNFAVYAMPGAEPVFVADDGKTWDGDETHMRGVFINTFDNALPRPVVIRPQYTATTLPADIAADSEAQSPFDASTAKSEYFRNVEALVAELKVSGGKAVLSRVICGDCTGIDMAVAAEKYFEAFPSTFRFLYSTAATGMWLGATPEILLDYSPESGTISTMALAGTRKTSDGPWDEKNVREHDFVTRYITDVLRDAGTMPEVHDGESVEYGEIQHLCHRITAHYYGPFFPLLHKLSPTPALAGVPLAEALSQISRYESHPRLCYGGYVGVSDETGFHSYVNLRSAHLSSHRYCIFAGGGITAASEPLKEWEETETKISCLKAIINNSCHG